MIDIKYIRENPDTVKEYLKARNNNFNVDEILELDSQKRTLLSTVEELKAKRNAGAKEVGKIKASGGNAEAIMEEMRVLGEEVKSLDEQMAQIDSALNSLYLQIPNKPDASVPIGKDEEHNVEVRKVGTPRVFDFEPQAHWDIGEKLDILDFERGAALAQSRFTVIKGLGARLERAIASYMLDTHTLMHGFTEINPPLLVNSQTMTGTAQLPKFAEDSYRIEDEDLWLIPTSEVSMTNLHAGQILEEKDLPKHYVSFTPCFRREAGSYGRDVRGIIRQHQFEKVEMVKIVTPERSYDELETMVSCAENILKGLNLPYRVITLCTGDMGFSAAKTYDLEVWLPSQNCYREISSCSNCEDFQARRMNSRYRPMDGGKPRYVHTLNGSGLAVGRTLVAVLENYQQKDGSVLIPEALRPYMHGQTEINPR